VASNYALEHDAVWGRLPSIPPLGGVVARSGRERGESSLCRKGLERDESVGMCRPARAC